MGVKQELIVLKIMDTYTFTSLCLKIQSKWKYSTLSICLN